MNETDLRSILASATLKRLGAPDDADGDIAEAGAKAEMGALVACLRSLAPKPQRRETVDMRKGMRDDERRRRSAHRRS